MIIQDTVEKCNRKDCLWRHQASTLDMSSLDKSDPLWYDRFRKNRRKIDTGGLRYAEQQHFEDEDAGAVGDFEADQMAKSRHSAPPSGFPYDHYGAYPAPP